MAWEDCALFVERAVARAILVVARNRSYTLTRFGTVPYLKETTMKNVTRVATLGLVTALILGGVVGNQSSAGVILVPNGDFDGIYKPDTDYTITATFPAGKISGPMAWGTIVT